MAKVFLVEDYEPIRVLVKANLPNHEVVLEASSLVEALAKVAKARELGCTVAIVDGSLGTGFRDGAMVAAKIRAETPGMRILAHSSKIQTWGDQFLQKPAFDKLNRTVSLLAGE